MGSADLMHRNLSSRVEVVAPIDAPALKRYLKDEVLAAYLRDNTKARELLPNGEYARPETAIGDQPFDAQQYFVSGTQKENADHASTV